MMLLRQVDNDGVVRRAARKMKRRVYISKVLQVAMLWETCSTLLTLYRGLIPRGM